MLPNFLIIGAMKAGTTSLYNYLRLHSEIYMCPQKEPHFFSDQKNWEKGTEWYQALFSGWKNEKAIGEASVSYLRYPQFQQVPTRIQQVIPAAKLICVVRNPIDRIYSHYLHLYREGLELRDLKTALDAPHGELPSRFGAQQHASFGLDVPLANINEYVAFSLYWLQLQQYLAIFPKEQLLVIVFEELINNPTDVLRQVYAFLEVDTNFKNNALNEIYNKTSDKLTQKNWFKKIRHAPGTEYLYYKFSPETRLIWGKRLKALLKDVLWYERDIPQNLNKRYISQEFSSILNQDAIALSQFLGRDLSQFWGLVDTK